MHGELPTFKRCCCCLPLRYGLLFWGYFMLMTSIVIAFPLISNTVELLSIYSVDVPVAMMILFCVLVIAEFIFSLFFIVAAHRKNYKLINVYCYYMMVITVLYLIPLITILVLNGYSPYHTIASYLHFTWIILSVAILNIVVHGYVILLARSEAAKLRDNCQFNFTNVGAEAECAFSLRTDT